MYHIFTYVWHIYSGHLPTKSFVWIPQMLWKFRIFQGHIPGHQGCFCWVFHIFSQANYLATRVVFFGFSTHAWDMYCKFTCVCHIYSGYLPTKLFVYMLQMLLTLRIFLGQLPRHQGCLFWDFCTSWDMYCIFTCVWYIYLEHLHTKLFVYTLVMLHTFHIFLGHLSRHQGCFLGGFPCIPRTCTLSLHGIWVNVPGKCGISGASAACAL